MDTTKKVNVTLVFMANIAAAAGTDQTDFLISGDVRQAIDDIRGYFAGLDVKGLLYTVMINDKIYQHVLNEGYTIREGDKITILPVTLGG